MSNSITPRPALAQVPLVPHGGFTSTPGWDDTLDFSSNVNPFGPTPQVWEALRTVPLDRHPDPRATPLRLELAARLGLSPASVIVGNGSVDLIYQLAIAFIRPGDAVLIAGPTFGEYAAAALMMGATVTMCVAQAAHAFALDVEELISTAQRLQPRLLFLCNPNNPSGIYLEQAVVARLLASCPQTLLVLDEAYVSFVAQPWPATRLLAVGNLCILRSLTKDYALTGLRAGYALAEPQVIAALEKVQPPWSVNAMAQAAALAALADSDHLRSTLDALAAATRALRADLLRCGWSPLPSAVHYFLLPVVSAAATTRALLEQNIRVRDCSSFGLPAHIRIATRHPAANARLLAALETMKPCQPS